MIDIQEVQADGCELDLIIPFWQWRSSCQVETVIRYFLHVPNRAEREDQGTGRYGGHLSAPAAEGAAPVTRSLSVNDRRRQAGGQAGAAPALVEVCAA